MRGVARFDARATAACPDHESNSDRVRQAFSPCAKDWRDVDITDQGNVGKALQIYTKGHVTTSKYQGENPPKATPVQFYDVRKTPVQSISHQSNHYSSRTSKEILVKPAAASLNCPPHTTQEENSRYTLPGHSWQNGWKRYGKKLQRTHWPLHRNKETDRTIQPIT